MDKEEFERRRQYAGPVKPSMLRRMVGHDYCSRQIYLVTMVTEGRRRLFGDVAGRSDASDDSPERPRMELSHLGEAVERELLGIPRYYPQIKVLAVQMMPDHVHGILFVQEELPRPLGQVIKGFKTGCNRLYRELCGGVRYAATKSLPSEQGLLFAKGFNDRLLMREGQLDNWKRYLHQNPKRLLARRAQPDLFRVRRHLVVAGREMDALGNLFLLEWPQIVQVRCSRSLTEAAVEQEVARMLRLCEQGAVLVTPSISPGEKAVTRAAFEAGHRVILLLENGLGEFAKPGGRLFDACAEGRLLLLAPWEHHTDKRAIKRQQCEELNAMAHTIANLHI